MKRLHRGPAAVARGTAATRGHFRAGFGSAIERSRRRLAAAEGITLIEVLVATFVLTVGLLSAFMMLTVNLHASADARAREGGVTLARQITEDARSIPYSQLSSSGVISQLQAMPGLASASSGSTWTIVRRGLTYTVTASVSTLNDPKDTTGAVDIKQVSATVNWTTSQGKTYQVTERTEMSAAGQDPGLIASNLALAASQQGVAGISGPADGTAPVVTSTTITSLHFQVTAPTGTTAIAWTLNGGKQSTWNGSAPSSGTSWTSAGWPLSGLSDGTYTVGAQAEDASGVDGPPVTITVRLIRNVPSAPSVTGYGFDPNVMVAGQPTLGADIQWAANPEMNVVGYRIYKSGAGKICETSTTAFAANCGPNAWCATPTACVDLSASTSNPTYTVTALYYDATNTLREGNPTPVTLASGTPTPPPPVPQVSMAVVTEPDDTAILTWSPPSGGTPVSFYRIYRGGDNYSNRYDTVPASSCSPTCTYHDTNRTSATSYWVTAVGGSTPGSDMAESLATGPVTG
jgi:Tfp pilus assembly protein PilV